MLEKLIQINEQRQELEDEIMVKKSKFEDSISLSKAQLEDLINQESILREEALLFLEAGGKNSEKVGDKTVSRQVKKTLKVKDPLALRSCLKNINIKDYGCDESEVINAFEDTTIIKDKKVIDNLISTYEKVEGRLLLGVVEQLTKYITIK